MRLAADFPWASSRGQVRKNFSSPFSVSLTLVEPVPICTISASSRIFWLASVTAEPYVPITAHTPEDASFWAARAAVLGSPASSSTTSSIFWPLIPPAAFAWSTSRLTIFFMSWPSEAHFPVSGHIRPILMSAAATGHANKNTMAKMANRPPIFFMASPQ